MRRRPARVELAGALERYPALLPGRVAMHGLPLCLSRGRGSCPSVGSGLRPAAIAESVPQRVPFTASLVARVEPQAALGNVPTKDVTAGPAGPRPRRGLRSSKGKTRLRVPCLRLGARELSTGSSLDATTEGKGSPRWHDLLRTEYRVVPCGARRALALFSERRRSPAISDARPSGTRPATPKQDETPCSQRAPAGRASGTRRGA